LLIGRQEGHLAFKAVCRFVGGDDLIAALHVRLLAPVVTTISVILSFNNTGQPKFTWKIAIKMERDFEMMF